MPAPVNTFKKALSEGETVFGCWVGLADTLSTELMGTAGFDWLVIDGEHGPNDLRSILAQLQVLEASDSHPVVRVPVGETYMLKQMLDAGAQTLLVPMVESADQARQLVRDVTYPPHGDRGVGYALSRAARFSQIADYGTTADAQICLLVQVENRKGLAALDDILAVDGIDGVFIGPADLAADMGHMGDSLHPDVQTAIMDALSRIRAAGKAPGILSTHDPMTEAAIAAGAQFVAVGADVLLLSHAAQALSARWKDPK
ncbi:aldolase/citrate lyase family protein [Sulfitobacter geojensis]|uniref:Hydroxypyruvate/pyruvate aldolase n=1 Tax=Sulfitobacter geojensis TaxID=1342299 RepID=A0AAE2VYF5_9RHOB|nr:HpcH/HpaI aldolase/citrate lyase family protein [Sulfitobacter geojensis]MBM1689710.1 HpcH/HpaI aldolase/citrate lyase family protein [Sulfitobacter geojensis]MBM1693776.1 HpcH/HpaI aldolase/citrate lyase family protein [Sulfitobacter geojensis]MBM1705942.1 HpcH/HpaI aldolase/citrate lyase family protein [Sulfitobacter geojensis]MBM1710000.1 HpcH/HpaI aldolase/citrate lyase family protein [Sulfitobacter geojensis]MBM1714066.1 HpcH/HpaI aldolase/citrate lyase family protein [Sulfitobacter ge